MVGSSARRGAEAPLFTEARDVRAFPSPAGLVGGRPMFESIAPLVILIVGALVGVLVGVAHGYADRTCSCCRLLVSRAAPTCPHCRCRMG